MRAAITLLAALITSTPAHAAEWSVDYDESAIRFEARQDGDAFSGRFGSFQADITFDPDAPENGRADVAIDLESAATGDSTKDGAMGDRDWFHVKDHPTARFTVEGFAQDGPGRYRARGTLTLKGESRDVDLPFTFEEADGLARVSGETTLDRTDFGVGGDEQDGVSNAVRVLIELTARRID